jgi:hypothetical protein
VTRLFFLEVRAPDFSFPGAGKRNPAFMRGFSEVNKMDKQGEKDGPVAKAKLGRFQVSIWKQKNIAKARNGFDFDREVERMRACVQYGRFNRMTKEWNNQSIWCDPEELRDLANALDQLNKEICNVTGESDAESH